MTNIIDRSPQKQFTKSALFTTATCISLMPILNSNEIIFSSMAILPLAIASTSSQDFKKTRMATSITSGLLISDLLLPSIKNPYLNIAKTAAIAGLIYLTLSPSKAKRVMERDNHDQINQRQRKLPTQGLAVRIPVDQNLVANTDSEPRTTRHNPRSLYREATSNPILQGGREPAGSR